MSGSDEAPAEAPNEARAGAPGGAPGAAAYTADEQRVLRETVAAGGTAVCPRDGAVMTRRPVGGGSFGLGYSRRREWLICPACRRSALFDVKRGTRN